MKLRIRSTTRLTPMGWLGAGMLIGCPLIAAIFYLQAVRNISIYSTGQTSGRIDLVVISCILAIVGYVLLSIGKETVSVAVSGEDAE